MQVQEQKVAQERGLHHCVLIVLFQDSLSFEGVELNLHFILFLQIQEEKLPYCSQQVVSYF